MKPEGSAECDQTLFFWMESGNETRKRGGEGQGEKRVKSAFRSVNSN